MPCTYTSNDTENNDIIFHTSKFATEKTLCYGRKLINGPSFNRSTSVEMSD